MNTKNYCHKCDTNKTGKPVKIKCEVCKTFFSTTHRPFEVVCPECTAKMNNDGVFRCRVCREKIDSALSDAEIVSEEKDMTRAYRRDKNQEKKKKEFQIKQQKKNNQKYISDDDFDDYFINQKMQSRKNSRHQDKQNINRGLREGFTYDDFDDMVGGKVKFSKNKRNF